MDDEMHPLLDNAVTKIGQCCSSFCTMALFDQKL